MTQASPVHTRVPSVVSIVKRHVGRGRIHGSPLDDYSQCCCDTPPLDVFSGTNPLARISFHVPDPARQINQSARLTRGTLSAMICRDCAAHKAALRARVAENFVRDAIHGMKLIIRAQKQKHSFPISRHISRLRNWDGSVAKATDTTIRKPISILGSSPRA